MNILVTGGAGYIGSHIVLKLKEQNHFIAVYDNLSKGHREFVFSNKFINGDIYNIQLLKRVIKKYNIDSVIHLASFIEADESMKDPSKYFTNNSIGSLSLLNAIIGTNVKNFIFSSTASVYGHPDIMPIKENFPLMPVNPYGESKLIVEKALEWYSKIYNFKYISLRYFNVSGADKKLRTGEMHQPETHLIPLAIQTAYGERSALNIYGTDYNTKDGTAIRDYIHVSDVSNAHLLALECLNQKQKGGVFNLGSECGYSVKEVIETVKKVTKRDFKTIEKKQRSGDPEILISSSSKIKSELNWKPLIADLKEIIETAVNFHKKKKNIS